MDTKFDEKIKDKRLRRSIIEQFNKHFGEFPSTATQRLREFNSNNNRGSKFAYPFMPKSISEDISDEMRLSAVDQELMDLKKEKAMLMLKMNKKKSS